MEKNKILLLTTMYPDPLRPGTKVCHYFATQWVSMGYDVLVVNYRSMFPRIYTDAARLFPKLAAKYVGNHVEMDRNMNVVQHEVDSIPVFSVPIFKFKPHGRYSSREIRKQVKFLTKMMKERGFEPDAIIGHFHNPQLEIVGSLKKIYPTAHTCVSLHELKASVLSDCYGKDTVDVLNGVDMIGYRSVPIKQRFESAYGVRPSLVCWSGTSSEYINAPVSAERHFSDGPVSKFIYVGQTIKRKYPKETIQAIYNVYGAEGFTMTLVGSHDVAYPEAAAYVAEHGLCDSVTFTGKIPRDEIIRYYDESEVFILISRAEVFGLVYLEAMARGCITIASRNEGMEGIIDDGVNGFLCGSGNVDELSAIIRRINALTAEQKQAMSDAARQKAAELSDRNVASHYIETVLNS